MHYLLANYGNILNVLAGVLEILGVLLMANHYTALPPLQVPLALITALWRGQFAKKAAEFSELNEDNALVSLQGLALIAAGFLCGSAPNIVKLFS
jgi:hypothetical protein